MPFHCTRTRQRTPPKRRLGPNGRIWVPPRNPSNRDGAAPIAAELLGSCRTVYTFPRLSRGPPKTDPRPTTHALDHVTAAAFAAASLGSLRTVYTPLKLTRGPTSGVSPIQREPPELPGPFTATPKTSPANPTRKPSDRSARRWSQRSPLTRLFTPLPQHSRPLPWGNPGLFTCLRNSRGDRQAEFHHEGSERPSGAITSCERQTPHRHFAKPSLAPLRRDEPCDREPNNRHCFSRHPKCVEIANAPG